EPSTGLDATARGALADLLRRHCADGGMLLTITHDLDLARDLGGLVLVMRESTVVERGEADVVLSTPTHPYTRRLLDAEPRAWDHPWMRPGPLTDDAPAVLTATGLSKGFGDGPLFQDVDLTVRVGDRLALTGPSGSGKTTLGNVLLGLAAPDTGQVKRAPGLAPGRVQKLYQDPGASFPARVPLGASLRDVLRRHDVPTARLDGLLAELRLPGSLLERRPGEVSGGELQRLAIIRAMLLDPVLLFADEPTSRLDLVTQEETIGCLMSQVAEKDCALVLVTHDHTLADAVADRTLPVGDRGPALMPTGSR
ncbi:peptide ABC transporter ATP-binding protein, partial [Cellulomonas bogoriensis 69B4 = DSM 16987]